MEERSKKKMIIRLSKVHNMYHTPQGNISLRVTKCLHVEKTLNLKKRWSMYKHPNQETVWIEAALGIAPF